jgi:ubiquinol-cytochrome c reductase cytochrome b subunit
MVESRREDPLKVLFDWIMNRLERTIFLGLRFTLPRKFVSPLGFLGFLTFVTFALLGVSGALLMLYYVPTPEQAFSSVQRINDEIPFGAAIRNIHYHASNAMILLALGHMFYQYFSGRYKLRYEVLWVTGIILGTLTIIEAYSGYDLILNERGMLAINIGRALARSTPVMGPLAYQLFVGSGLADLIVRFYSVHVFIIPLAMVVIMLVHFPRYLVLDIPVVSTVVGSIFVMGGMFPVELGVKFVAGREAGITFPEWYLTGLYAVVRTGIPAFIAGAILPAVFIVVFLVVPFIDTGKKLSVKDRPFYTAMGVAGIAQLALTTVWGFRADNIFLPLTSIPQLMIDPALFFGGVAILSSVCYAGVYAWIRATRPPPGVRPGGPKRFPVYQMTRMEFRMIVVALLAFMVAFDVLALQAALQGLQNLVLLQLGIVLVAFGTMFHVYRLGSSAK